MGTTPLSPDWSCAYDGASRLTSATYPVVPGLADPLPVGLQAFPYDDAGNRDDDPTDPSPWTYNENNEIEASPELRYEFDADGNLCKWVPASGTISAGCGKAEGETILRYSHTNRLQELDRPDGIVSTYRYDPFGRRLEKTVDGTTTWFLWDGDRLLAEYDGAGARTTRYAHAGGYGPLQLAHPNAAGEDVYEVHTDRLDAPRLATNAMGSTVWRGYYEAYGTAHIEIGAADFLNVRFPGQYYDHETERWDPLLNGGVGGLVSGSGLHWNRFRTYGPEINRFIQADPIDQAGGINTFAYSFNDPVNNADPFGLNTATIGRGAMVGAQVGGSACGPACAVAGAVIGGGLGALIAFGANAVLNAMNSPEEDAPPESAEECQAPGRFTDDQEAVVDLAQEAGKKGGLPSDEAEALVEIARDAGLPARGPESHPDRPKGKNPHIHIGPINHIPVK